MCLQTILYKAGKLQFGETPGCDILVGIQPKPAAAHRWEGGTTTKHWNISVPAGNKSVWLCGTYWVGLEGGRGAGAWSSC